MLYKIRHVVVWSDIYQYSANLYKCTVIHEMIYSFGNLVWNKISRRSQSYEKNGICTQTEWNFSKSIAGKTQFSASFMSFIIVWKEFRANLTKDSQKLRWQYYGKSKFVACFNTNWPAFRVMHKLELHISTCCRDVKSYILCHNIFPFTGEQNL